MLIKENDRKNILEKIKNFSEFRSLMEFILTAPDIALSEELNKKLLDIIDDYSNVLSQIKDIVIQKEKERKSKDAFGFLYESSNIEKDPS